MCTPAADGLVGQARRGLRVCAGMAWSDLERLIDDERAKGAPIATMIAAVRLAEGRATLLLRDPCVEDSDVAACRRLRVNVDLSVNAHSNAKCAPHPPGYSRAPLINPNSLCGPELGSKPEIRNNEANET